MLRWACICDSFLAHVCDCFVFSWLTLSPSPRSPLLLQRAQGRGEGGLAQRCSCYRGIHFRTNPTNSLFERGFKGVSPFHAARIHTNKNPRVGIWGLPFVGGQIHPSKIRIGLGRTLDFSDSPYVNRDTPNPQSKSLKIWRFDPKVLFFSRYEFPPDKGTFLDLGFFII